MAMLNGDVAAAKKYIAQSISINPKQTEAYANRGLMSLIDGDVNAAEADIIALPLVTFAMLRVC